ncbi:MAG: PD-(D/E)XK nuclease family protein [Phycisphaeraceae bacterium]
MPEFRVTGVCERDIDLLLLEELAASEPFLQWFIRTTTALEPPCTLLSIGRSVTQSSGESDLELLIREEGGQEHRILIENKVDASFQKDQAGRYRQRAELYLSRDSLQSCTTILVAPEVYLNGVTDTEFDQTLSYETIASWLEAHAPSPRTDYKLYMLRVAIGKARQGYNPVEDSAVTDFWRHYWRAVSRIAPELEFPEPGGKASTAGFFHFRPGVLPRGTHIIHKPRFGVVDLQIDGMGLRLREVTTALGDALEPDMTLVRTHKSAAVRLQAEVFDFAEPYEKNHEQAEHAMRLAKRLFAWAQQHRARVQSLLDGP